MPTTGRPTARAARVKVNVSKRGTSPVARISRPSRKCQGVPGSLSRAWRPPIKSMPSTIREDHVDRSRNQAAVASPDLWSSRCWTRFVCAKLSYSHSRSQRGRGDRTRLRCDPFGGVPSFRGGRWSAIL